MSSAEQRGTNQKYDWRTYETPTKTTANILEELVDSPKSHRSDSSSSGSFVVLEPQRDNPPLTPLPLYPPKYNNQVDSSLSPPQDQPQPPPSEHDVRQHQEQSPQPFSHKSQESFASSIPRRLSDEFQRPHERSSPSATTTTNGTAPSTSPTDSHPGRHHARTHARSAHARSRSSSESLSSLLLVTTERLSRETARANEAERKSAEIMSLFKHTFEAKTKLERDLIRVQQELDMYKVQFDAAQKEIYRAQDVVDRVERERVAAIQDAARARDKVHKLNEARAIELAMEEGRRFGYEEGLRQGRYVQPVREASREARHEDDIPRHDREPSRDTSPSRRRRASSRPPPPPPPAAQSERPPSKVPPPRTEPIRTTPPPPSSLAQTAPVVAAPPPLPLHRHGTPPDVGNFQRLLPRPTITTPMPVQVPSTQPQPPPPMPPHQAPTTVHDHSSHPEKISVQPSHNDHNGSIHPIPVWNHSPSVMHERIVLPPDNYIPTMDANSVITLPPPHELSRPVPPKAPPLKNNVQDDPSQRPRSQSRGPEKRRSLKLVDHEDHETTKSKNYFPNSQTPVYCDSRDREREREREDASRYNHSAFSGPTNNFSRKYATMPSRAPSGRSGGVLSIGSTHLSDLDLLSPPPDDPIARERHYDNRYQNPLYRNQSTIHTPSPPQRIAQEWRNANRQFITPQNSNVDPPEFERPLSAASQSIPRPPSRRPREIVMPAPLAEVYLNTTRSPRVEPQPILLNHTPPGIEVVTPSTHASSRISVGTVVDPVLLTPESANRPHPLPAPEGPEKISIVPQRNDDRNDYADAAGSIPLSPISGMTNLKAYPPGFAPSLPKDHEALGEGFKYPSSPLMR